MNLKEISEYRNEYSKYLPNSYLEYLDDLNNNQQCSLLEEFINAYPDPKKESCDDFFYNMSYYGFNSLTMTFIEDIRSMKDLLDKIYSKEYGKKEELTKLLRKNTYKTDIIIFRFVIMKVIDKALNKLFETVRLNFDETVKISLIINITFMAFVFIGFISFWLPFVFEQNETIYKAKNMLNIIPKEVLIELPNINTKLGIEGDN